jgi:hypothetical protein
MDKNSSAGERRKQQTKKKGGEGMYYKEARFIPGRESLFEGFMIRFDETLEC